MYFSKIYSVFFFLDSFFHFFYISSKRGRSLCPTLHLPGVEPVHKDKFTFTSICSCSCQAARYHCQSHTFMPYLLHFPLVREKAGIWKTLFRVSYQPVDRIWQDDMSIMPSYAFPTPYPVSYYQ